MSHKGYYALVTSLPHLPRFDKASRLPITRERLLKRLNMLDPEDYQIVKVATEFLAWRRQPIGRTDADMVAIYQQNVDKIFESPRLKPLFELTINQKTILTALRRRSVGLPRPQPQEAWGAGPLVPHIVHNWDKPFFKLQSIYPWLAQAHTYWQTGDMLQLEHLLFNVVWNKLDYLLFKNYFGLEAIVAYLLKWDILRQWLSYHQEAAKTRFETLVMETLHEYQQHSN